MRPLPKEALSGRQALRFVGFRGAPSGQPPGVMIKSSGLVNRATVPKEPHGAERRHPWVTVRDQTWGADARLTGLTYSNLVFSRQTRHLQLQEPHLFTGPAGHDSGREMVTRPALEGPRYRFTAVDDAAVIAEAKRRAKARVAAKGGRKGIQPGR